jgi:hypothetical protein
VHPLELAALLFDALYVPCPPAPIGSLGTLPVKLPPSLIDRVIPAALIRIQNRRLTTTADPIKPPACQTKKKDSEHGQDDEQHDEPDDEQQD